MQTSVIRRRVADFLQAFPPFDTLPEPDLLELAGSGKVRFHESDEYIFRQGERKAQLLWVIQQGRVELLEETAAGQLLRDVLGEGDLLGLERFVNDQAFLYAARTCSDVILYGIAAPLFESLITRHPAVKRFLMAHFSAAGMRGFGRTSWLDADPPPPDFLRSRLALLPPGTSRTGAAALLQTANNGVAAFVDSTGRAEAVLTPMDLSAAGDTARSAACPFRATVPASVTTRHAVREMLRARTEHLAVTADGSPASPLEAILTATELGLFCGHNPAGLVQAIRRAAATAEIVPLLRQAKRLILEALAQPHDIDDCCSIASEIVAALADTCIRLSHENLAHAGLEPSPIPCCWLIFGQSARGDLLQPVLPAIAAVYDDSATEPQPRDRMYFAAIAGETLAWFHACGLTGPGLAWPHGSEPSMPLAEWKRLYTETIRNPLGHDLYTRRDFFDIRALRGDASILEKVLRHLASELDHRGAALALLANDTLAHLPPLTFFRGAVVALDGAQLDTIDLRLTVISPIADAARVFAIGRRRLAPANTLARLEAAQHDFPDATPILAAAADAFRIALYYEALAGGVPVAPSSLGRFDQRLLKTAFHAVQRLLEFTSSRFLLNV